jgi:6-phosphogluconolactonase
VVLVVGASIERDDDLPSLPPSLFTWIALSLSNTLPYAWFRGSDFDKLAHGPRGTKAKHPIYVYRFHPNDGSLVLLNVHGDANVVINPAFSRYHPNLNVVYTCTEDIERNGRVFAYKVTSNGELCQLGESVDAGGTSTCYLTIDKAARYMLCVNYWDSTLAVIPLDPETGAFAGPVKNMYDPKEGKTMVAAGRCAGGVNHSNNDDSTIRMRQADPHSHALVLDPFEGCVAYVPDLGKDLVREFFYDRAAGKIDLELNVLPSGLCTGHPDGPRYFEFHPKLNVAYVVNELSSTIAVFEVDRALLHELAAASNRGDDMSKFKGRSTLRLIQSIKTIPSAFPTVLNTCGRICVHKSGRFVVVSNRGHQSIAIFRVSAKGRSKGELTAVGYFHTRGETPRHFQFDASGQYLLVANQDTDSLAVFNFNLSSGVITFSGNEYKVPSPNFVCCCPMLCMEERSNETQDEEVTIQTGATVQVSNLDFVRPTTDNNTASSSSSSLEENSCTVAVESNLKSTQQLMMELELARQEITSLKMELNRTVGSGVAAMTHDDQ